MTKRIAFLAATEGIEAIELTDPWEAVTSAWHTAELITSRNPDDLPAFNKALLAALS